MRAAVTCLAVAVALALTGRLARADADESARVAAAAFGRALESQNAAALLPLLPTAGRVHVTLLRLGPEEGRFGATQVVALFRDFMAGGKISTFEVLRCEGEGGLTALAHGRALVVDREGRSGRVGIHLALEREDGRWVIREVKETAP